MRQRTFFIGLLLFAVGVAVVLLVRERLENKPLANVLPVPDGDQEIAWFHTSTSGASWERFVVGIQRAQRDMPGLQVDDTSAFLEHTTSVPEVVLSWKNQPGKLRI